MQSYIRHHGDRVWSIADIVSIIEAPEPGPGEARAVQEADCGLSSNKMDKIALFIFLIVATTLEATGDALVRLGINQSQTAMRALLFLAGATLLFGYGVSVNLPLVGFGRVVGLYIATLFIVWQIVNFIVFRAAPTAPVIVGGLFIVAGGFIVTLWK